MLLIYGNKIRTNIIKKFNGSDEMVVKMINRDKEKYIGRQLVHYTIIFHQNEKPDSIMRSSDVWLNVTLRVYNIKEKKEDLFIKVFNQCDISWRIGDFKVTKFSLKFVLFAESMLILKVFSLANKYIPSGFKINYSFL